MPKTYSLMSHLLVDDLEFFNSITKENFIKLMKPS